jgi:hypothetical protein
MPVTRRSRSWVLRERQLEAEEVRGRSTVLYLAELVCGDVSWKAGLLWG